MYWSCRLPGDKSLRQYKLEIPISPTDAFSSGSEDRRRETSSHCSAHEEALGLSATLIMLTSLKPVRGCFARRLKEPSPGPSGTSSHCFCDMDSTALLQTLACSTQTPMDVSLRAS